MAIAKFYNCSGDVYLAEASYIKINGSDAGAKVRVIVQGDESSPTTILFNSYLYGDTSGDCVIDLTEVMRSLSINSTQHAVTVFYNSDVLDTKTFVVSGVENYKTALCGQPRYYVGDDIIYNGATLMQQSTLVYLPPKSVYFDSRYMRGLPITNCCCAMSGFYLGAEGTANDYEIHMDQRTNISSYSSYDIIREYIGSETRSGVFYSTTYPLVLATTATGDFDEQKRELCLSLFDMNDDTRIIQRITVRQMFDHNRYCRVKWQNRFGFYNYFIFELHNCKRIVEDTREINSLPGRMYNVSKRYNFSGTLFLDGLSAYDVWFYSDIITSRDVSITIFPGLGSLSEDSEWEEKPIKITTDEIKIPHNDTGAPFILEIDFEYYNSFDFL